MAIFANRTIVAFLCLRHITLLALLKYSCLINQHKLKLLPRKNKKMKEEENKINGILWTTPNMVDDALRILPPCLRASVHAQECHATHKGSTYFSLSLRVKKKGDKLRLIAVSATARLLFCRLPRQHKSVRAWRIGTHTYTHAHGRSERPNRKTTNCLIAQAVSFLYSVMRMTRI